MSDAERPIDPGALQRIADACAKAMWADDKASQALGMQLQETRPGYARISMRVREDMVNGHDLCHGGFIFTLADSAFAVACNYKNYVTVASGGNIDFITPALLGQTLEAVCQERTRAGRTGVYDAEVHDQEGRLVAVFRGRSYQTRNRIVPELETLD
ncbi:MAG TPA: hydroxyphenylacetyl-CoA thioesterase PaaI [Gammaproteobacteria bacterium]|nr:hydroxyphenylacetyl-CoA thioesterase PaaI [Gammaproteobacteria bacterium]